MGAIRRRTRTSLANDDFPKAVDGGEQLRAFCMEAASVGVKKLVDEFKVSRGVSLNRPLHAGAFVLNSKKNRNDKVICGDKGRVVLSWPEGHTTYIHANWIPANGENRYICTQNPMSGTTEDFWRMVWQEKCKAILMLGSVVELGEKMCHQYWPVDQGHSIVCGPLTIRNVQVERLEKVFLTTLEVRNEHDNDVLILEHILWKEWSEQGTPNEIQTWFRLMPKLGSFRTIVVHCYTGVGRTGILVGVDLCLSRLLSGERVQLSELLKEMRSFRHGAVETAAQYISMYRLIFAFATQEKILTKKEGRNFTSGCEAFLKRENKSFPCLR